MPQTRRAPWLTNVCACVRVCVCLHQHRVLSRTGAVLGKPAELKRWSPHPRSAARIALPPHLDMPSLYNQQLARQNKRQLPHQPPWVAQRDPLAGNPARAAARAAATLAVLGPLQQAWVDVIHNEGRLHFAPAFIVYLSFR